MNQPNVMPNDRLGIQKPTEYLRLTTFLKKDILSGVDGCCPRPLHLALFQTELRGLLKGITVPQDKTTDKKSCSHLGLLKSLCVRLRPLRPSSAGLMSRHQ